MFHFAGSKSRNISLESDGKPSQPLARKPTSTSTSQPSSSQASTTGKEKRREIPVPLSLHAPSLQKQGKLPPALFSPTPQKIREAPLGRRSLDNESPSPAVVLIDCKFNFFCLYLKRKQSTLSNANFLEDHQNNRITGSLY